MTNTQPLHKRFLGMPVPAVDIASALTAALVLLILSMNPMHAQTFEVLHTFSGPDGAYPIGSLTVDRAGNIYGTTTKGGTDNVGTVFKLRQTNGNWILAPLHVFAGGSDGSYPLAGVTLAINGIVYGTTQGDTAFSLRPGASRPTSVLQPWNETVLLYFMGSDGSEPGYGNPFLDQSGNVYDTTIDGGQYGAGVVYELSPSGGGWTDNTLYSFGGTSGDGMTPYSGLIMDGAGNLYGTTGYGGANGYGTVYELTPSGSGWTEQILHSFTQNDGALPIGGLIFDAMGNLYGTTSSYGPNGGGTVFELSPSNGGWTFSTVYAFTGQANEGPYGGMVMDTAGHLYGTTLQEGADGEGSVFQLTSSQGIWMYSDLYDFTDGNDGANPYGTLVLNSSGSLYGTAYQGGAHGEGTVFQLTP
jgi:uncharacterized repeat protein (TIGR03803 family)